MRSMPALRSVVAVILCLVCVLAGRRVSADDDSSAQLAESLAREARRAFVWRASWTGVNAVLSVGSAGALAFESDKEGRPTLIVSAIASGLGAALNWGFPLEVEADARRAVQAARLPPAERRERLLELYAHAAADESERVRWYWHVINIAAALVPAAIILAGYQRYEDALVIGLSGIAVGELNVLTQPTRLADRQPASSGVLRVTYARQGVAVWYGLAW